MMTRKMKLIAGVAGMALAVPALAQKPDRGGGQEKEQQQAQRGGGEGGAGQQGERPQRAERQQAQQAERPQRMERQQVQRAERPQRVERQRMQRAERPQQFERQQQRIERQVQRQERPQRIKRQQQRAERQVQRQDRPQRIERQQQRAERQVQRDDRSQRIERQQQQRIERQAQRPDRQRPDRQQRFDRQAGREERQQQLVERQTGFDRGPQRIDRDMNREARQDDRRQQRFERNAEPRTAERLFEPRIRDDRSVGDTRTARFDGRGYRPLAPAFAARDMRPMQSFKSKFAGSNNVTIGDRYDRGYDWSPVPAFYGARYVDNGDHYYRYNDDYGYAYQIDRQSNVVSALYPLFGGYGIGDPWPQTYYSSYVPAGYSDYYYDTPDYFYRNDGYGIYQVDSGTQLITALVSLVLGQSYGVGQALPASYSAYNVPLDYRANYVDDDDRSFRYGDGFIYEVDPRSRVVAARYPLYADDYDVGERWPVAYPDYNVPSGYRSAYADTPQYQYRYANGGIYQVDPTNQLILALAALVSGDQFAVGQPMPSGYDIYNVPVDYRDRYADSDDEYYRYANGYVYRVDYDSNLIEEGYPIFA